MRCFIASDDFTGAADAAVQIRCRCGNETRVTVVFSSAEITAEKIREDSGSWVIDSESRFLSKPEAFRKLRSETENLPFAEFHHVIKKVDSTLRGNIDSETRALDETYEPELIVFAPAFPAMGRVTLEGIQYLNGTRLLRTEIARDPKTPVFNDNIHKIMKDTYPGENAVHIGLDALRGGTIDFEGARVFSFDAETSNDLQSIVRRVLETGRRVLWVGSAGLVDALLGVEKSSPPALAVVASVSSVSRAQVRFAEKQGIALVSVPVSALLDNTACPLAAAEQAIGLLEAGRDLILHSSSTYSVEQYQSAEECARQRGLSPAEAGAFVQRLMGEITGAVLERVNVSGLFLSGGDTAVSCIKSLGAAGSDIENEIASGIPLMRLAGGRFAGLPVVTKAGGFGNEDAIAWALRILRGL